MFNLTVHCHQLLCPRFTSNFCEMYERFVVTPGCGHMVAFRNSQERVSFADGNDNLFPFHLILKPPEHLSNFPHPVKCMSYNSVCILLGENS